nr:hypothetical protein [Tanacetum cinerariifolium]
MRLYLLKDESYLLWISQLQGHCFGFVEFEAPKAVQKAIESLHSLASYFSPGVLDRSLVMLTHKLQLMMFER